MGEVVINIEGLTKQFGGLVAVSNVDAVIYKNEILGLIGPNGAGKTTCFNMIAGFLKPTQGSITYRGKSILKYKPHQICSLGIARTFQSTAPFGELNLLENIMTGTYYKHSKATDAYDKAKEIFDTLHFASEPDKSAYDLTTVDRKKLEVARALALDPDVLLLDEVMAGCNPQEKLEIVEMIRGLRNKGITIIVIEHDIKTIMSLCDRIIVLDRGEKIAEGQPEEVANNPAAIVAYLGKEVEDA